MKPVPHGEPYAGKLHVRFDEGAGAPDEGRSALLYLGTDHRLSLAKYLPDYATQRVLRWLLDGGT